VIEKPSSDQMRINIKIELMPDALHEFVLVSVTDCDNAELTARILAMADKVLSVAHGSKINEPLPGVKTVTSYSIPTDSGVQSAEAVRLSLCKAGFENHCGPVTRITPSPSEYQPSKYEASEEPCP
jgi:hypothetical protein